MEQWLCGPTVLMGLATGPNYQPMGLFKCIPPCFFWTDLKNIDTRLLSSTLSPTESNSDIPPRPEAQPSAATFGDSVQGNHQKWTQDTRYPRKEPFTSPRMSTKIDNGTKQLLLRQSQCQNTSIYSDFVKVRKKWSYASRVIWHSSNERKVILTHCPF